MAYNNFTFCCGIAEVGSFDGETASEILVAAEAQARTNNKGALIATTVGSQRTAIAALKAAKFEPIERFRNPNTDGTMITVWFKNINHGIRKYF